MKFSISKKGFTLIDVLVGISILLIAFLGIFAKLFSLLPTQPCKTV